MLYGSDNGRFGGIKTNLENNITCGLDIYPNTKEDTVGLINNCNLIKQPMWSNTVKEEVAFVQTIIHTNTSNTNKKG